ncbi:hypothetical protein [Algoriphagus boritolerans]|uniref:hypothetical protein n=1 Tax=Algoriphagus boritolerans TaxID=308111 RepID=UPI000A598331
MTYYGRWTYKYEEAARQGALGCLIVHNTIPAGYGFNVVQGKHNQPILYLDDRGSEGYKTGFEGWITLPSAKKNCLNWQDRMMQNFWRKPGSPVFRVFRLE